MALADGWRVPYLLTVDDFLPPGGSLRLARRWCRGLIAGGRELADDLVDLTGVPRSWVHVLPPGLPLPDRPACPRSSGVKVVGVAGAMAAGSGLATFLAAAVRVIATGLDVEFVLAGHGPDEPDLRRRADRLGIAAASPSPATPATPAPSGTSSTSTASPPTAPTPAAPWPPPWPTASPASPPTSRGCAPSSRTVMPASSSPRATPNPWPTPSSTSWQIPPPPRLWASAPGIRSPGGSIPTARRQTWRPIIVMPWSQSRATGSNSTG